MHIVNGRKKDGSREDFLNRIVKIEGIYVPEFYKVIISQMGQLIMLCLRRKNILRK